MARSIFPAKRSAALLLALALLPSWPFGGPAGARAPVKQNPKARQVLVVTANLEEAWNPRDNANTTDLAAFVQRLDYLTPHAPDILLLQEITQAGAEKVARLLKAQTSRTYAVAAKPGRTPADVKKDKVITRETAILINVRTMKRIGRRHYVDTTFAKRHGRGGGGLREIKRNAVALVRERATGITYPVASVHFHTSSQLRSKELSRRYRKVWSRRVDGYLARKWPVFRRNAIIGGDFNATRERWKRGRQFTQRWWRALSKRGYRDTVYEVAPFGGVDYIFTRTRIAGAGVDKKYERKVAAGTNDYYSDHRLRWALLGRWRPSAHVTAQSSTAVKIAWDPLPSVKRYVIQKRERGSSRWTRLAGVRGRAIKTRDLQLEPRTRYRYRMVADNGAELSDTSRVVRVRTKRDMLEPRRPASPNLHAITRPLALRLKWRRTPDRGGTGGVSYEVWRTEAGEDPTRVTIVNNPRYVDRGFSKRLTLEYFIIAVDGVGNRSERSRSATILPSLGGSTAAI